MSESLFDKLEELKARYSIPEISDELLEELNGKIEPVVRNEQGQLFYMCDLDLESLRNTSFIWSPELVEPAHDLLKVAEIKTLHTYGYYGMFKASVAQVLSQIPIGFIDKICAYEVIGPNDASDLAKEQDALNAGFHVATTVLYERV